MHGLWDPETFKKICDFETWEKNFVHNKDIEPHIAAGRFVPIYVHSDGSPLIEIRVGGPGASARFEQSADVILTRKSKPYLFVSSGSVAVSGIEYINGGFKESPRMLALSAGRWVVEVFEAEPRVGLDRKIANEVPNFVVLINPELSQGARYSTTVETFE